MRIDNTPQSGAFSALVIGWVLGWGTGAIRALVAMKGWEWFVTDTFGVRSLSFVQAWGLFMLISFATFHLTDSDNNRSPFVSMTIGLVSSLMFSGLAFVAMLILAGFR